MKVLFIITNAKIGYWLSELTHPYFLLSERGIEIDIASLKGGATTKAAESDPYFAKSWEPNDLMSKGFLSDTTLVAKVDNTLALADVDLDSYDAVHVVGGIGAAVDLFPSEEVGRVLEHFFAKGQLVGAICHGVIALGNTPSRINGKQVTGLFFGGRPGSREALWQGFHSKLPAARAGKGRRNVHPRRALGSSCSGRRQDGDRTESAVGLRVHLSLSPPFDRTQSCPYRRISGYLRQQGTVPGEYGALASFVL